MSATLALPAAHPVFAPDAAHRRSTGIDAAVLPAPDPRCRAVVIIPARNEEAVLTATLDALRLQIDDGGSPLPHDSYEVLLLLNNCTDRSLAVAERYARDHPGFLLRLLTCHLPPAQAHVGTARRALMDLACDRLELLTTPHTAILSTDADTLVHANWIAANLGEIEAGADAVGGTIELLPHDLDALDPGARLAYERDRLYQRLVARLESLLDPDPADPWPRHLQHFGASLACTPAIYRLAGGLPPVKPLEDVAFVDALRKVGARIRHSPAVRTFTSARLDGRAEVGLSGQLRLWQQESAAGLPHLVDSAEWLEHRFATLAGLRRFNDAPSSSLSAYPAAWRERLRDLQSAALPTPRFLELLDADTLIEALFLVPPDHPPRRATITETIARLRHRLASATTGPANSASGSSNLLSFNPRPPAPADPA
jgi:hypothetical protein